MKNNLSKLITPTILIVLFIISNVIITGKPLTYFEILSIFYLILLANELIFNKK